MFLLKPRGLAMGFEHRGDTVKSQSGNSLIGHIFGATARPQPHSPCIAVSFDSSSGFSLGGRLRVFDSA